MNLIKKFFGLLGSSRALDAVQKSSDLILAAFLILVLIIMIIPIPPPIIDVMLALNLTAAISLLMVAIYVPSAVHLSIFPSLLLVTTLFRLGVNIASTKQILLHANAGEIIFAFGEFVVGGNFIVGGVIFLIITLVQFMVITKGAERVAEVAARFTLDGMPGKQMAIDADVRAGTLNQDQARKMRQALQKESQLYGAMDGAMKFVKGDAIAGIVITLINVVGGLLLGWGMYGMGLMQAAQTYSLLSIGDGLVSQIPALLIGITAGLVTTRVTSDSKDSNLGQEISTQLLGQPRALMIAAGVLFGAAFVPGFPSLLFIAISLMVGSVGYGLESQKKAKKTKAMGPGDTLPPATAEETGVEGHTSISGGGVDSYALTLPVIVEAGEGLSNLIRKSPKGMRFIEEMIPLMRQALYQDSGIRFPGVHVRTSPPGLGEWEYNFLLNEVPVVRGRVMKGHFLTNEVEDTLNQYNIPFTSLKNALNLPTLWVEEKYEEILTKAGIKFWRPLEVIILHLSHFFRKFSSEFLGIQEVKSMLEFMEKSYPDLIKEVTRLVPLQKLTEIFKRLAEEQVSVKDLRSIMESLSDWAQSEKDTVLLTEYVRSSLKRYISYKYAKGQSVISVYLLDPEIEDMVRGAIKQTSAGSYLALDPDSTQMILQAIRSVVPPTPPGGQPPVMLTAIDVRRFVQRLLQMEFPDVAVVSYQEIVPEIRIQPLGRIQIS